MRINRSVWRMMPGRAEEFYERLGSLLNEFVCNDDEELEMNPEASNYGLVLFFYPTASRNLTSAAKKSRGHHTLTTMFPSTTSGGGEMVTEIIKGVGARPSSFAGTEARL